MITDEMVEGIEQAAQKMITQIEQMDQDEKDAFITKLLIDTGALNADGTEKEQIVTGDFFGW